MRQERTGFGIEAAATIYSLHHAVMPRDPNTGRTQPAPAHPEGLAVAEDSPVHIGKAVDVRNSRSQPAPPPEGTDVPFTLPMPAEERKSAYPPAFVDDAPDSEAPDTVNWDRVSARLPSSPNVITEPHRNAAVTIDTGADHDERDAIMRDLRALGPLDERPDRTTERAVAQRATLARARALRFRLALLSAWSGVDSPADRLVHDVRALQLDLSIDAMLLVAIADGAPGEALPVVSEMVAALRGIRPDLPRTALRDRGSAAIARLTIVGFKSAIDQLGKQAVATPPESRRLALDLAARVALTSTIDEHRLGALHDLERALALPVGSVAPAIETARRRRARSAPTR